RWARRRRVLCCHRLPARPSVLRACRHALSAARRGEVAAPADAERGLPRGNVHCGLRLHPDCEPRNPALCHGPDGARAHAQQEGDAKQARTVAGATLYGPWSFRTVARTVPSASAMTRIVVASKARSTSRRSTSSASTCTLSVRLRKSATAAAM